MPATYARPLLLCLLLMLAGCARAPTATPSPTASPSSTPTPLPSATPLPTAAAFPSATPQVFCPGLWPSLLIIGERGRVTRNEDERWLNMRAGPGTDNEVIARLAPLEGFLVLDGAVCDGPYAWFQISYRGALGWIAEGYEGQYFAEPWLEG